MKRKRTIYMTGVKVAKVKGVVEEVTTTKTVVTF
jgi:hypothetical protein